MDKLDSQLIILSDNDIQEKIKQENLEEIKQILDDSKRILDISKDLNQLLKKDTEHILSINDINNENLNLIKQTDSILEKASSYKKNKNILILSVVSGLVGAGIFGPVGGVIGTQISLGLVGVFSGSLVGGGAVGITSYNIFNFFKKKYQKKKKKQKTIKNYSIQNQ